MIRGGSRSTCSKNNKRAARAHLASHTQCVAELGLATPVLAVHLCYAAGLYPTCRHRRVFHFICHVEIVLWRHTRHTLGLQAARTIQNGVQILAAR